MKYVNCPMEGEERCIFVLRLIEVKERNQTGVISRGLSVNSTVVPAYLHLGAIGSIIASLRNVFSIGR